MPTRRRRTPGPCRGRRSIVMFPTRLAGEVDLEAPGTRPRNARRWKEMSGHAHRGNRAMQVGLRCRGAGILPVANAHDPAWTE